MKNRFVKPWKNINSNNYYLQNLYDSLNLIQNNNNDTKIMFSYKIMPIKHWMRLQYIDFALRHVAFILPEDLNSDLGLSTISILWKHQPTG